MSMRLTVRCSVVVFVFLSLTGCAGLGSKSTIYDQQTLQRVRSVCLAPVSVSFKGSPMNREVRASLYDLLKGELDSRNLFLLVTPDNLRIGNPPEGAGQARIYGTTYAADAVLYASLRYFLNVIDPVVNAEMTLTLIETETGKTIASSSHNTQWGNSYIVYPKREIVTSDAVKGAVAALEKVLKRQD